MADISRSGRECNPGWPDSVNSWGWLEANYAWRACGQPGILLSHDLQGLVDKPEGNLNQAEGTGLAERRPEA